jgi:hypothetical protein
VSSDILSVLRTSPEEDKHVLALINVTNRTCRIEVPLEEVGIKETRWVDVIHGHEWIAGDEKLTIPFEPYEIIWLKPSSEQ